MNQVAMKKREIRARQGQGVFHNTIGDLFSLHQPISTNLNLDTSLAINSNSILDYQNHQRQEEMIKEAEEKQKGSGDIISRIFGYINDGLNTAQNFDKTLDAFKNDGTEVSSNGVDLAAKLGDYPSEQPSMTKYFVIGGVLIAIVIAGVVLTRKK